MLSKLNETEKKTYVFWNTTIKAVGNTAQNNTILHDQPSKGNMPVICLKFNDLAITENTAQATPARIKITAI